MSGEMVRAILDGRKTQTRRVVKPAPWEVLPPTAGAPPWPHGFKLKEGSTTYGDPFVMVCPYGNAGDRLWVKETFSAHGAFGADGRKVYRADIPDGKEPHGLHWKPSIFCSRKASRITLEVVAVRVERLHEITRGDCMAEGCPFPNIAGETDPRRWYSRLWEAINGRGSWNKNQWVWVIEFKRISPSVNSTP